MTKVKKACCRFASDGLKYLIFAWGSETSDAATFQVLVMDQDVADPHKLGFPKAYHSWRHCYAVLVAWLEMNLPFATDLTGIWGAMMVITTRTLGPETSVLTASMMRPGDPLMAGTRTGLPPASSWTT